MTPDHGHVADSGHHPRGVSAPPSLAGVDDPDLPTHLVHRLHDPQRRRVRHERRLGLAGDEAAGELGCLVGEAAHVVGQTAGALVEDLAVAVDEPDRRAGAVERAGELEPRLGAGDDGGARRDARPSCTTARRGRPRPR